MDLLTQPVAQRQTALWVLLTVLASLVIPGGGFLVAALSLLDRFRVGSPSLTLLLVVAAAVLALQVLGLYTFGAPWTQQSHVGPVETVG